MNQINLRLLGAFELQSSQGLIISIPSKKARLLLAFLASRSGYTASRLQVAQLLWEHHEPQQALTNLRQTLAVLNGLLAKESQDWLDKHEGYLTLNAEIFHIDVQEIGIVRQASTAREYDTDLALYRGEFLEGMSFHEPALSDWLDNKRREFLNQQIELLGRIVKQLIEIEMFDMACGHAEILIKLDPVDEVNHQNLMVIYSKLGQRHRILRQYQQCCQVLETYQLGEPQTQTTSLFQLLYSDTQVKPLFEEVRPATTPSETSKTIPAIAVLPFRELLVRPESFDLSSALTGEIVNELRRFHGFRVISALSSMSLKDQNCDLKMAANILGARYLVSGSIQQSNSKVQIAVELVDAANGELIWADRYLRQFEELFVLQAELARGIAGAIEPEAVGHAYLMSSRKPAASLSAWDLVLRGDHSLFKQIGTRWNSDDAQRLYQKAIELDPDYAPSYSGLAYSLCLELKEDIARDTRRVAAHMLEMAEHAVSLDNGNPWCLVVLARAQQQLREYDAAVLNYRKAVALCPSSSRAQFGLSFGLSTTAEYDEAVTAADKAIELSPRDPMSWSYHTVKSLSYIYSGRFEEAASTSEIAMNSPSANHWAPAVLAPSLVHLGRYDDAIKVLESARKMKPDISVNTVEGAFTTKNDSDSLAIREGLIEAGLSKH